MPVTLSGLPELDTLPFDGLIDARSPAEFAEDHIPGAVNLPVLSNDERARVGTIYVQESRFRARRVGGALVARNIAAHLEGALADRDGAWRPLVYCWRGGQRSGAFANYLREVGWRADTIEGGYRSYRRLVAALTHERAFPAPVVLLDGNTGTAKTELLALLWDRGVQVLDLEGAANHRGSAFGARAGGQPSQKMFEGRLAAGIARLDPTRPVVIEAEGSRVGRLNVPPTVWAAMKDAPRITVSAPLEARADYLTAAYADLWANPEGLEAGLAALQGLQSHAQLAEWRGQIAEGRYRDFVMGLMVRHYDPLYTRKRAALRGPEIAAERLDRDGLARLADQVAAAVSAAAVPAPASAAR